MSRQVVRLLTVWTEAEVLMLQEHAPREEDEKVDAGERFEVDYSDDDYEALWQHSHLHDQDEDWQSGDDQLPPPGTTEATAGGDDEDDIYDSHLPPPPVSRRDVISRRCSATSSLDAPAHASAPSVSPPLSMLGPRASPGTVTDASDVFGPASETSRSRESSRPYAAATPVDVEGLQAAAGARTRRKMSSASAAASVASASAKTEVSDVYGPISSRAPSFSPVTRCVRQDSYFLPGDTCCDRACVRVCVCVCVCVCVSLRVRTQLNLALQCRS
jgi:hypothetical protein